MPATLTELFRKYGTEKLSLRYDVAYERHCSYLLAKPDVRVLEIGVLNGASIRVWREWFGPKAYIAALDRDSDNLQNAKGFANDLFWYDQANHNHLASFITKTDARFDLIIDDGSHRPADQMASFQFLWPYVVTGGTYVIEDTGSNLPRYRRDYNGPMPVDMLYQQALHNMGRRAGRSPEQYISYCGMATFIYRLPPLAASDPQPFWEKCK